MTLAVAARRIDQTLLARMAAGKGCLMEITNLGKADGLPPVDWAVVVKKLDAGSAPGPDARNSRTTWLSTVNEDGSPHVTAVGALWMDGTFWFQTGAGTKAGRALLPRSTHRRKDHHRGTCIALRHVRRS